MAFEKVRDKIMKIALGRRMQNPNYIVELRRMLDEQEFQIAKNVINKIISDLETSGKITGRSFFGDSNPLSRYNLKKLYFEIAKERVDKNSEYIVSELMKLREMQKEDIIRYIINDMIKEMETQ